MSSSSSGEVESPRKGIPSHVLRQFVSSSSSPHDSASQESFSATSEEKLERRATPHERPYDADDDLFASEDEVPYRGQECSDTTSSDSYQSSPEKSPPDQASSFQRKLRSMVKKPLDNIRKSLRKDVSGQRMKEPHKENLHEGSDSHSDSHPPREKRSSSSSLGPFPEYTGAKAKYTLPKKREVFPVDPKLGNFAVCQEPRCTKSYNLKFNLKTHLKDIHGYSNRTMPSYVRKMKEAPRKYKCPGCKEERSRIQEHYDICKAYQSMCWKEEKKNRIQKSKEQSSSSQRYPSSSYLSQSEPEPVPGPSFNSPIFDFQPGPSTPRVEVVDAYKYMKQCLKDDYKLAKKTKETYKMRIKGYFKWLQKVEGIPSWEVLNMYSANYKRLPRLEKYIKYLKDKREKLSGSKLTQIASAYQYLCKVIIHWILQNWEALPWIHRADSERYYSGLITDTRSSLKNYSKQQDKEAEKNAGETSSRLGANTEQLVEYSKVLHGDNDNIDDYFEKLYSMENLYARGELTHVEIRDFILLMIITGGNGSRLDALMNLTVKEWMKRFHKTNNNGTVCVVSVYEHKTAVDGPVRLVFDERLETVTELYRLHIRPNYVRKKKDPGTLFVTHQGNQVQDLRNVKSLLGKFCNISAKNLEEIRLYDFRHAVANWAKDVEDDQVRRHIAGAMNHSSSIHEKRYNRDKDAAKTHIYNAFGKQINRKATIYSETFQQARHNIEQAAAACTEEGEESTSDVQQSPDNDESTEEMSTLGSLSRHVIPSYIKSSLFDTLRSLKSPPGKTLRDSHINEAFKERNFEQLFQELKVRAVYARQLKGKDLKTEIEKEREARRLLKTSWRAMHRD